MKLGRDATETASRLGVGVGLRPAHYTFILENPSKVKVDWFEATSENYMGIEGGTGGRPLRVLEQVRRDFPVVLHGVSLSVGSVDPLDFEYLSQLKALADRIQPACVSDHLCWTGVQGENLHDLLPLPYTEEALRHLVPRIQRVQEFLGRQFVIENVSSYLSFTHSEMTEWEFLAELARRSGCALLLDVNNIYVSAQNHGFRAEDYLNGIAPESVAYMHLAGHSALDNELGRYLLDTHDHPVCDEVWSLYVRAQRRFGRVSTLLEWDDRLPSFEDLEAEAMKIRAAQTRVFPEAIPMGFELHDQV